jgi:type I restriction enzyme, R subunit
LNLRRVLATVVDRDAQAQPFLLSIGERAEALAQAYYDRHQTTQQVLAGFEQLAQEYVEADTERQKLGLDANAFAVYTTLKPLADGVTTDQVRAVMALFLAHPDYQWNEQERARLRNDLYQALRPLVGAAKMVAAATNLLNLELRLTHP